MRTIKQRFGEWDENEASDFMATLGNEILPGMFARNEEIDIHTMSEDATIIVEGRALPSDRIPRRDETSTRRKQSHKLAAVEDCAQRIGMDHWPINAMFVEASSSSKPLVTHSINGQGNFINPGKWDTF